MLTGGFYVRCLLDDIPEAQRANLAFRAERNYPVLAVDPVKNRLLLHDDHHRLVWMPQSILRFVKLA